MRPWKPREPRRHMRTYRLLLLIASVTAAVVYGVLWWKAEGQDYFREDAVRRLEEVLPGA